jgi:outer membrane protein OmpA-like peptidoglycan-associated protein
VRQHGAVFLNDAEQTLAKARTSWNDRAQVDHLAYLAQRKVEIAQSITGLQVAAANLQVLAANSAAKGAKLANRPAPPDIKAARGSSKPTAPKNGPQEKPTTVALAAPVGAALDSAAARQDPRSAVFTVSGIKPLNDRMRLTPDAERSLTPLVTYLQDNQNSRIIIEGYSDGKGSHEDDLAQSLGVAEATRSYLTGKGIDGGRIFTLGRGADGAPGGAKPAPQGGRVEIGLFQGIGDPAPALTKAASSPPPAP